MPNNNDVQPYIDMEGVLNQLGADGTQYLNVSTATTTEQKQVLAFAITGSMQQPTETHKKMEVSGRNRLGSIIFKNIYVPPGLCKHRIVINDSGSTGSGYKYLVREHKIEKLSVDNKQQVEQVYSKYLTIEPYMGLSCVISFTNDLQYSFDTETWTSLPANTTVSVGSNRKIYFKANITPVENVGVGTFSVKSPSSSSTNVKYVVSGNPLSLIYGDNAYVKTLDKPHAYYKLFYNTAVYDASNLQINEVTAYCCKYMFANCTELVNVPSLPADTLAQACYYKMFQGCTKIENAPLLTAETLVQYCYQYMFDGCTKLNRINAYFLTTPEDKYTLNWLNGVSSSGSFTKNRNATWNVRGTNAVPSNWTIYTYGDHWTQPMGSLMSYMIYNYDYFDTFPDNMNAYYELHYSYTDYDGEIYDKVYEYTGGGPILYYSYHFVNKSWAGDQWDEQFHLVTNNVSDSIKEEIETPPNDLIMINNEAVKFYTETCVGRGYNVIPDAGEYHNGLHTLLLSVDTFNKGECLSYTHK